MSGEELGTYFESANEDQIKAQQAGATSASSESRSQKIAIPGKYLMRAKTTIFRTKDNDLVRMPRAETSDKGSVSLVVNLEVVDGTENTPAGSYISTYVTMLAAPGATQEKIENTYKFSKPILCALLGVKEIKIEKDWLAEHLLFEYTEDSPGKFNITRDHKMGQVVMATVEFQVYNGKERLRVSQIVPSRPGDKSTEFAVEAPKQQDAPPAQSASGAPVTSAPQETAAPADVSLEKSDESFDPSAAANSATDDY
jgi:hypothetical protein